MVDASYTASVLSPEQFEFFREATLHALANEPASNWPRFDISFCKGGVFIFVASNPKAKAWLTKTVAELRPWYKATACKQAKTLMGEYPNPNRAADMRRLDTLVEPR